jgi:hypothetical protein
MTDWHTLEHAMATRLMSPLCSTNFRQIQSAMPVTGPSPRSRRTLRLLWRILTAENAENAEEEQMAWKGKRSRAERWRTGRPCPEADPSFIEDPFLDPCRSTQSGGSRRGWRDCPNRGLCKFPRFSFCWRGTDQRVRRILWSWITHDCQAKRACLTGQDRCQAVLGPSLQREIWVVHDRSNVNRDLARQAVNERDFRWSKRAIRLAVDPLRDDAAPEYLVIGDCGIIYTLGHGTLAA